MPLSGLLSIDDITVATLPRGGKERLKLLVLSDLGEPLVLRALVAVGQAPGPTLLAVAGVHGDEYEGMAAVREVFAALDPGTMSGSLLAIPVANPLAYAARTRSTPSEVDGLNLARVFPGDAGGTVTQRLAHHLLCLVERNVGAGDLFVDLHSGSADVAFAAMAGFRDVPGSGREASEEAARHFGLATPKQRGGGSRRSGPRSPGGRGANPRTWRHMSPVCAIFWPTSAFTNTTTPRLRFVGMDQRARRSISFRLPVVFSAPPFNCTIILIATRGWERSSTSTVMWWPRWWRRWRERSGPGGRHQPSAPAS
ncbi:MAG: hypothetical protein K0S78_6357 [Thermomicrobiales bacterium]|nr:hypothetical protein [Thermomicrobiales bacterium]